MSRSKEHRFQVAGKERENGWQNCGSACKWGGGWGANLQKERKRKRKKERKKERADNKTLSEIIFFLRYIDIYTLTMKIPSKLPGRDQLVSYMASRII